MLLDLGDLWRFGQRLVTDVVAARKRRTEVKMFMVAVLFAAIEIGIGVLLWKNAMKLASWLARISGTELGRSSTPFGFALFRTISVGLILMAIIMLLASGYFQWMEFCGRYHR